MFRNVIYFSSRVVGHDKSRARDLENLTCTGDNSVGTTGQLIFRKIKLFPRITLLGYAKPNLTKQDTTHGDFSICFAGNDHFWTEHFRNSRSPFDKVKCVLQKKGNPHSMYVFRICLSFQISFRDSWIACETFPSLPRFSQCPFIFTSTFQILVNQATTGAKQIWNHNLLLLKIWRFFCGGFPWRMFLGTLPTKTKRSGGKICKRKRQATPKNNTCKFEEHISLTTNCTGTARTNLTKWRTT